MIALLGAVSIFVGLFVIRRLSEIEIPIPYFVASGGMIVLIGWGSIGEILDPIMSFGLPRTDWLIIGILILVMGVITIRYRDRQIVRDWSLLASYIMVCFIFGYAQLPNYI